jgi:hypothetical protein
VGFVSILSLLPMIYRRLLVPASLFVAATFAAHADADSPLILNEYNCVSDTKLLEADNQPFEGYDYGAIGSQTAAAGLGKAGRILGNGGNWIELVVAQDRVDLRGYTLEWDNADPDAGNFTFASVPAWSNVRAGTIITVIEDGLQIPTFADGTTGPILSLDTDLSFNPGANDYWMNVDVDDSRYVDQSGLKVDNDNWRGRILRPDGGTAQDYIGESSPGWGGTGINNQEMGVLTQNPTTTSAGAGFNDLDYSTFGAPNLIDPTGNGTAGTFADLVPQDFFSLHSWWTNRLAGDANINGAVGFEDLVVLAQNYNLAGKTWFDGDFTLNGTVDFQDLIILAQHYGTGAPLPIGTPGSGEFAADWALARSLVPEPTTLLAIGVAAVALRRWR